MIVTAGTFSSCLKDSATTVDFSKGGKSAEIPLSGLSHFASDAITSDTITLSFGVNIASSSALDHPQDITVDVIPSVIASYNAANPSIVYEQMPASAYTFKTTVVTIPAGGRYKIITFKFDKSTLDPSKSYMLPIGITKADGLNISSNQSIKYYHVIGNDFAGTYLHDFTRTPAGGNFTGKTSVLSPVSPTQFEVAGGYFQQNVRYEVTFTKTGTGSAARYSNFQVSLNSDDVKSIFTPNSISVTTQPSIAVPGYDPNKGYTFAEAQALFTFQFDVLGGSGARHNVDRYYKQ